MNDGFLEAICRGYRKGFLTDAEYHHLRSASTLSDVRVQTDYGNFLMNEQTLDPSIIQRNATEKWCEEFKYIRSQAVEPMATFMDYICYQYMFYFFFNFEFIFRTKFLEISAIMESCHPLGMFDESTMKAIASFEPTKKGTEQLIFRNIFFTILVWTVLIGTSVGKYFEEYLLSLKDKQKLQGSDEVTSLLSEQRDYMLQNGVMKLYLEDFYTFTQNLGGETAEIYVFISISIFYIIFFSYEILYLTIFF
eukprot:GSMAST32.ASY1.ANO1.2503.1 assembled CDS